MISARARGRRASCQLSFRGGSPRINAIMCPMHGETYPAAYRAHVLGTGYRYRILVKEISERFFDFRMRFIQDIPRVQNPACLHVRIRAFAQASPIRVCPVLYFSYYSMCPCVCASLSLCSPPRSPRSPICPFSGLQLSRRHLAYGHRRQPAFCSCAHVLCALI